MRRSVARLKGLGFILWHARHELYHVLLGLVWAWFLREQWHEFNGKWIVLCIFGSLLPDIDHFFYFFGYGKHDPYTQQILQFFRDRQWRGMTVFMENGHKHNTNLSSHNFYFIGLLVCISVLSFFYEWRVGVILFGAMLTHYLFDVFDDVVTLGRINPNWKRWGKPKKIVDRRS